MNDLNKQLSLIAEEANKSLSQVTNDASLEEWRIQYLGRNGKIPKLLRRIKDLSEEQKKEAGQLGNKIRQELETAYIKKLSDYSAEQIQETPDIKYETKTAEKQIPNTKYQIQNTSEGHLHPLSVSILRVHHTLTNLGFLLAEGPLAEDTKFAFDLLNIPLEHPARGLMDTFYLEEGQALRPHTSPVQLRSVIENNLTPPFKVYSPGRVFRAERTDASHQHTFYQVEALMVGENVSIADFKGVVEHFFSAFFGRPVTIRLRPSYFPFVEPGFEVDMQCIFCQQNGCSTCQQSGWIEMMGAGMVHPNVLRNMNVDPNKYQGFAFGIGFDRMVMLLHGINDIRLLLSGDLRFLRQFY
jgi:phenylalanyl-tRNA synthetase alpha chain